MKVKFDNREGLPAIYNRAIAHVQPQGASYVVYDDRNSAAQLIVKDGIGVTVNLFVPAVELSATAAGTGGFVINGQCAGDKSGNSVSAAGDVNGDGSNSTEFEIESDSRWTAPTATLRRVGPVARVPDDTIGPWAGTANPV